MFWLFKTEPDAFSWQDLKQQSGQKCDWEGVRNYQARNYMKNMKLSEKAFFYHSNTKIPCIMGIVRISKTAFPDHHAWNPQSKYYDIKCSPENPRWFMVEVTLEKEFSEPITREELKKIASLQAMELLRKGSRLSVLPVQPDEWNIIAGLRK